MRELEFFRRFAVQGSALAALGPQFQSWINPGETGLVRCVDLGPALVAAGEPFAPPELQAETALDFVKHAGTRGVVFMPVRQTLAKRLGEAGLNVVQTGVEPVFEPGEFFRREYDPFTAFPVAFALKRRGGEVREVDWSLLAETGGLRTDLERLIRDWLAEKPCPPLGFLSAIDPFRFGESKRWFILRVRGEVQAFCAASPYQTARGAGMRLSDVIRSPFARAGGNELLMLEAMASFWREGVVEITLGKAPLAGIPARAPHGWLLNALFKTWRLGYCFQSQFAFKDKMRPTALRPLYTVSNRGIARTLWWMLKAHCPEGVARTGLLALGEGFRDLALKPEAKTTLGITRGAERFPKTLGEYFRRTALTTALVSVFTLVHILSLFFPELGRLYDASAYIPGAVTLKGLFVGPIFHNTTFHLFGDQLCLYVFGSVVEMLLGSGRTALIAAAGLWLSNPATQLLVQPLLALFFPNALPHFLAERDYGSSNAVFALVGVYAGLLARPKWLLVPFTLYGAFICLARNSPLALHHVFMLGAGLWYARWFLRRAAGKAGRA